MKKKLFVFLFNGYSDWEIAYLSPEIYKDARFDLIYCSMDGKSIRSMGGLQVQPDLSISEIPTDDIDMLILPGGTAWERGENHELDDLAKAVYKKHKPIAAICAATSYLAQLGFLNDLKHTSNDLNYLKGIATQYCGEQHYVNSWAVTDNNIITANGVAPIEFAREIFKKIALYEAADLEKWFQLFKNGIWTE